MAPSKKRTVTERKPVDRRRVGTRDCPCLRHPHSTGLCEFNEWLGTTIDVARPPRTARADTPLRLLRPQLPVAKYKDCTLDNLSGYMYLMVLLDWVPLLALFTAIYVAVVVLFALLFAACNADLAGQEAATARDYFNLSVQTMATIGYGVLFPKDSCSNWVAVIEAFVSMIVTSLMTGVAFVKFARPRPHMIFSHVFTVSEREPTGDSQNGLELNFRIVNGTRRELIMKGEILEVSFKLILMRIEETKDGDRKLCYYDLHLKTTSYITLRLEAEIVHEIEDDSPFFGMTKDDVDKSDFLLILMMSGVDETLHDMIHQRFEYSHEHMRWGAKFVPLLRWDRTANQIELDFDHISATVPALIQESQDGEDEVQFSANNANGTTLSTETEGNDEMDEELKESLQNVEGEQRDDDEADDLRHTGLANAPIRGNGVRETSDYSDLESMRSSRDDEQSVSDLYGRATTSSGGDEDLDDKMSSHSIETNSGSENEERHQVTPVHHVRFDRRSRTTSLRIPRMNHRRRRTLSTDAGMIGRRRGRQLHMHEPHPALHDQPVSLLRRRVRFKNHPLSRFSKGLYYRALETSWLRLFVYLAFIYFFAIAAIALLMRISSTEVLLQTADVAVVNKYERIFFFCAQTLSTIGYGSLSPNPQNDFVNFYVFVLASAGIVVSTLVTGLAWAKFSIPQASTVIFSDYLLLTAFHSHRAIMFRAANSRTYGAIIEGSFRVSVVILNQRLGHKETHELKLVRNVWPVVQLGTTVTHIIDRDSPLFDIPVDELLSGRHFFVVLFTGLDPIIVENMFSRKTYHSCDILVGHHFAENMKITADGVHIDLEAINDTTIMPDVDLRETRLLATTALEEATPSPVEPESTSADGPRTRNSQFEIELEDGASTSPRAAQYALV